jgi:hypothetical protein
MHTEHHALEGFAWGTALGLFLWAVILVTITALV